MVPKKLFTTSMLCSCLFALAGLQKAQAAMDSNLIGDRNNSGLNVKYVEGYDDGGAQDQNTDMAQQQADPDGNLEDGIDPDIVNNQRAYSRKQRLTKEQIARLSRQARDYKYYDMNERGNVYIDNSGNSLRGFGKKKSINLEVKDSSKSNIGIANNSMKEAFRCYNNGDYEVALYHYRYALEHNHNNPDIAFGLGTTYQKLRQYDQAIEMYKPLLKNGYERKKVMSNLLMAIENKSYDDALQTLTEIDMKTPGYADIVAQIGVINIQTGDYKKAISALVRANDMAPTNALILYNLGYAYDKDNNYDYAKHFYEQAVKYGIEHNITSKDFTELSERIDYLGKAIKAQLESAK